MQENFSQDILRIDDPCDHCEGVSYLQYPLQFETIQAGNMKN